MLSLVNLKQAKYLQAIKNAKSFRLIIRAKRTKGQMNGDPAQGLIGGSINMQILFLKEDQAWNVENDLIAEAQLALSYKAQRKQDKEDP